MKRTPLLRRLPLRARKPMRRGRSRSRYAARDRETDYMLAVKQLPCMWPALIPTICDGVVEADHAGRRALSHKADDRTCVPACTKHHRQRTDFSGPFRDWTREQMREALAAAIERTQRALAHLSIHDDVRELAATP